MYSLSSDGFPLAGELIKIQASVTAFAQHDVFVAPWRAVEIAKALAASGAYARVVIQTEGRMIFVADGLVRQPAWADDANPDEAAALAALRFDD